jgi:hypothetical protein
VNPSDLLSSVATYGIVNPSFSIKSRIYWTDTSTYLARIPGGLSPVAHSIADLLTECIGIGPSTLILSSSRIRLNNIGSFVASVIARHSASHVDSDTALCFLKGHRISDDPKKIAIPEFYFREFVSPA